PASRNAVIASIAPGIGSHDVTSTPSMSSRSPSTPATGRSASEPDPERAPRVPDLIGHDLAALAPAPHVVRREIPELRREERPDHTGERERRVHRRLPGRTQRE